MITPTLCLSAVMLLAWPAFSAAADAKAGRELAAAKCQVCHGIDGIAKIPVAPHLAGESEIYLQTQLKAFRSGKRVQEMMSLVAKDLSDDDIANVAAWYSSIEISVTVPSGP
jgi:cytochrome c553